MSFLATLRRFIDSRPLRTALVAAVVVPAVAHAATPVWQRGEPLPLPRTEVAAARSGNELVVVGGYVPWGDTSAQADAYTPATRRWRRLPDLPVAVNHAMAATWRGKAVVVGGYARTERAERPRVRARERSLARARTTARGTRGRRRGGDRQHAVRRRGDRPRRPHARVVRARPASATAGGRSRDRRRASISPSPRRAAASTRSPVAPRASTRTSARSRAGSRGHEAGHASRPIPVARGGTGATAVGRIDRLDRRRGARRHDRRACTPSTRRASAGAGLPDLPTPRHGLGVVATGRTVYAIAGGPQPGLTTSGAVESITLP